MSTTGRIPGLALRVTLIAVTFSGFFNLASPTGGPYPATVLVDLVLALLLALSVLQLCIERGRTHIPPWVAVLVFQIILQFGMAAVSPESPGRSLATWQSRSLYAALAIAVWVLLRGQDRELARTLKLASVAVVIIAVFGIAQYILAGHLPAKLRAPADSEGFGYYGTSILRANGLVGNTIVFGSFLGLFWSIFVARLLVCRSFRALVPVVILGLSLLATVSRVAITAASVGIVLILVVTWARRSASTLIAALMATSMLGVLAAWSALPDIGRTVGQSFLLTQVFGGGNASVRASNAGHLSDRVVAWTTFTEHPFAGAGLGTQSLGSQWSLAHGGNYSSDGALWAVLAEGGMVAMASYAAVLIAVWVPLWRMWRMNRRDWLSLGLLIAIALQCGPASVFNSAIFGKAPFVAFWILFGVAMARSPSRRMARGSGDDGSAATRDVPDSKKAGGHGCDAEARAAAARLP